MIIAATSYAESAATDTIRNDFGGVGLIEMPSARLAPDGALSTSASFFQNTQHYNFTFQALPWLETSFRYSGLSKFAVGYPVYWDRAFAAKARIFREDGWMPAIAIGVNDLVGTGVYSGEYVVASKQLGNVDATLGLGWGRLASANTIRNPFSLITSSFQNRTSAVAGLGGEFSFNKYFHGPDAGLFGGVVWHTPIQNLSLVAEYSSDSYEAEAGQGTFKPRSQLNFGFSYHAFDSLTLGINWLYGTALGGTISFELDPTKDPFPQKIGPELPQIHYRSQEEQLASINSLLLNRRSPLAEQIPKVDQFIADVLWKNPTNIRDIAISGRTLVLTVRDPSSKTCDRIAQLVVPYAGDISDIVMQNDNQKQLVHCAISHGRGINPQRGVIERSNSLPLVGLATHDVFTIHAETAPAITPAQAIAAIRSEIKKQGIVVQALSLSRSEVTVYYSNTQYFSEFDAVDRLVRILMANTPPNVEKFTLIAVLGGEPLAKYAILRATAERSFAQEGYFSLLSNNAGPSSAEMYNPILSAQEKGTYPRFSWTVFPQFRQELFDPSNPFGVQLLAGTQGVAELLPGLALIGEAELSIYDDFNTNREPDSALPHVRSDFLKYFTQGKNGIGALELDYRFRLSPTVFALVKAGYLESMFAGFGGEILWRPEGQRWALGGDVYDVKQRKFDRLFGFQNYHQTTGHVSVYYASPWYNLNFQIRAGQYLAGDRGLTFQVSRRFSSGVEIGVFATKTNVSAQQFGEGSFDKGIILRIPVGWALPINTINELDMDIRPTQRDGGQTLLGDAPLYRETERNSLAEAELHEFDLLGH